MGIYGMGQAFNLRYANSGQFRPQHVRMGLRPPIFGGGSYSETTNVTVNNGPTGFWGFLSGAMNGLFGGMNMGGLFGGGMNMGMGGYGMGMGGFSPFGMGCFGMGNAAQIGTQAQNAGNKLSNLKTLYPKYQIVQDDGDKFSATDSDGHLIGKELSYEDMLSALDKAKKSEGSGSTTTTGATSTTTTGKTSTPATDDTDPADNTHHTGGTHHSGKTHHTVTPQGAGNTTHSGSASPSGWYRAANDKTHIVHSNLTASQITSNVLNTKEHGVLNKQQQAQLRQEIINKNPSVFDKDGNPKPGADYSKLDIPTMATIEKSFGLTHGKNYKPQDDQYSGKTIYTARNGDYGKTDNNGKLRCYDKSGNQMSIAEFKRRHPTLDVNAN